MNSFSVFASTFAPFSTSIFTISRDFPFKQAWWRGVSPFLSFALTSAPCFISCWQSLISPIFAAAKSSVSLFLSLALKSIFFSFKNFKMSLYPSSLAKDTISSQYAFFMSSFPCAKRIATLTFSEAMSSGVFPLLFFMLKSAPLLIRYFTVSGCPNLVAQWRSVQPALSFLFTSNPKSSTKYLTTSIWPSDSARDTGKP